jgi:D-aminoacyl-tRNA deacylase
MDYRGSCDICSPSFARTKSNQIFSSSGLLNESCFAKSEGGFCYGRRKGNFIHYIWNLCSGNKSHITSMYFLNCSLKKVGIASSDKEEDSDFIVRKLLNLRLWPNDEDKPWSKNVVEMKYEILSVSQFTLHGDVKKGAKPSFHRAMKSDQSKEFYDNFLRKLRAGYEEDKIKDGEFGAMMDVKIINDGPVTLIIDSTSQTTL